MQVFPRIGKGLLILALLLLATNPIVFSQAETPPTVEYYRVETMVLDDGTSIDRVVINGPPTPPDGYERTTVELPGPNSVTASNMLTVPAYDWSYGCSATSAAMISAYYDRNGYPDMYTGPTNGSVMPLDNSTWGAGECPLSASHNGIDGRAIKGHVDDYWIAYLNTDPDPWIGNWAEHTPPDCTGDFMRTNQSTYGNTDGSTSFVYYTNGAPTPCSDLEGFGIDDDGGCGHKYFYESRGYTVVEQYNQYVDTQGEADGFTYAQYMAEIDAGRPVMIHVTGHTMVGIGYDDSANVVYFNDTWDYLSGTTHSMIWGGSYLGMDLVAVTIAQLDVPPVVELKRIYLPFVVKN